MVNRVIADMLKDKVLVWVNNLALVYMNPPKRKIKKTKNKLRPSDKKKIFLVWISIKKGQAGGFFWYLLFPIACFLYTLLPTPRDTLEFLGKTIIKRNIRY